MAEYQRVEYRIGKDGKITETVIDGLGAGCTATTHPLEQALGEVMQRELLPEYHAEPEILGIDAIQTTLI